MISTYQAAYNHFPVVIASTNHTTYLGHSTVLKIAISWTIWQHIYLREVQFMVVGVEYVFIIFLSCPLDKETPQNLHPSTHTLPSTPIPHLNKAPARNRRGVIH